MFFQTSYNKPALCFYNTSDKRGQQLKNIHKKSTKNVLYNYIKSKPETDMYDIKKVIIFLLT